MASSVLDKLDLIREASTDALVTWLAIAIGGVSRSQGPVLP